jgi:hypothetical protein
MGKREDRDSSRKINVEIAPGNRERMARYIEAYNRRSDRKTPKIKYTDVVNDALDKYLSAHQSTPQTRRPTGRKK